MGEDMERRLKELEAQMVEVNRVIAEVKTNNSQTKEMYEAFSAVKGGFVVLGWIGKLLPPLLVVFGVLATVFGGAYVYWKTGQWQVPPK